MLALIVRIHLAVEPSMNWISSRVFPFVGFHGRLQLRDVKSAVSSRKLTRWSVLCAWHVALN